jgi:hypothetical protein
MMTRLVYKELYADTRAEKLYEENRLRIEPKLHLLINVFTQYVYMSNRPYRMSEYTQKLLQFVERNTILVDPYFSETVFDDEIIISNLLPIDEIQYAIDCALFDINARYNTPRIYQYNYQFVLYYRNNSVYELEMLIKSPDSTLVLDVPLIASENIQDIMRMILVDLCTRITTEMSKFVQQLNL